MEQILIIDQMCSVEYDSETCRDGFLNGVDRSIVKVSERLSEKAKVVVAQNNRLHSKSYKNLHFVPYHTDLLKERWKAIISVRFSKDIASIIQLQKETPIWIWLHDVINIYILGYLHQLKGKNIGFVTVSDYQKNELFRQCKEDPYFPFIPKVETIYNSIDDDLHPDETPVDMNKLMFSSYRSKGFDEMLDTFKTIHEKFPQFHLVVTYIPKTKIGPEFTFLGPVNHMENIRHLRSSLCLFSLNSSYPETFGLTMAEANAVGTPVLAHPFGALPETLIDQSQFVNTHDVDLVIAKLLEWQKLRPQVNVKEEFRLSNVIKQWEKLLEI